MAFPLLMLVVLLALNSILEPGMWRAAVLAGLAGAATPLAITAIAETGVILLGNGALDISVGPLMSVINVVIILIIGARVTSPIVVIAAALGMGLLSGLLNGFLVSFMRLQAIVVTFGTFIIYSGLATHLLPQPGGSVPPWLSRWNGSIGPIPTSLLFLAGAMVFWWVLSRTRLMKNIYAIGGDERASYVSSVPVAWVKLAAFMLTGLLVGFAALMLTSEVASGDGTIGNPFTLTTLAAVALGGTSLMGGRGGIWGSVIGAFDIFLIDNLITVSRTGVYWQDVVYGGILVVAVVLNSLLVKYSAGRREVL
jgi:ribose transport system permease protein